MIFLKNAFYDVKPKSSSGNISLPILFRRLIEIEYLIWIFVIFCAQSGAGIRKDYFDKPINSLPLNGYVFGLLSISPKGIY